MAVEVPFRLFDRRCPLVLIRRNFLIGEVSRLTKSTGNFTDK